MSTEPNPQFVRRLRIAGALVLTGLAVQLTATNTGLVPLLGVTVEMILPEGLATFFASLSDDGVCPNSVFNANLCEPRERLVWQLGTVAAGKGVTVTTQPLLADTLPSGTVLTFDARAGDSTGQQVATARALVVEDGTVLELALRENVDPVAPGASLTYTLTLGKVSAQISALGVLRFQLPAGTTFVSATGGGTHLNGVVTWNLPPLPAGQTGTRSVTVNVDPAAAQGTALRALAQVTDIAGYTALMGQDEERAVGILARSRAIVRP